MAALNALGIFWYLFWRESNLSRAFFTAILCLALVCIAHPSAIFGLAGFAIVFSSSNGANPYQVYRRRMSAGKPVV